MDAWLFVIGVKQLLANGDSGCFSTHISLLLWLVCIDRVGFPTQITRKYSTAMC